MKNTLKFLGTLLILAAVTATAAEPPVKRPNVLFIAVDDLNHWVGYLGRNSQTQTPNIDRLAKRGVWFTHSYCAAPVCNPSRAALMSGLRPGATGVYDNNNNFQPVIPEEITLTTQFRKAGYFVCGAGKIFHSSVYRPGEWDDWLKGGKHGKNAEEDDSPQAGVFAGKLPITPLNCRDEEMPDYAFAAGISARSTTGASSRSGRRLPAHRISGLCPVLRSLTAAATGLLIT